MTPKPYIKRYECSAEVEELYEAHLAREKHTREVVWSELLDPIGCYDAAYDSIDGKFRAVWAKGKRINGESTVYPDLDMRHWRELPKPRYREVDGDMLIAVVPKRNTKKGKQLHELCHSLPPIETMAQFASEVTGLDPYRLIWSRVSPPQILRFGGKLILEYFCYDDQDECPARNEEWFTPLSEAGYLRLKANAAAEEAKAAEAAELAS